MKIAVVGGGLSGLTAAYLLSRAGHDVTCYDAAERPGGLMRSERRGGYLCETGPQGILDGPPEVRALIEDVGLKERAIGAAPAARRRYVFVRGKLRAVPSGPFSLMSSDVLSASGKWRLLQEPFVKPPEPAGGDADESVLAFGTRRLGSEAAHTLLGPAVIGIFAGDAGQLSLRSAFPRLAALEARHGSLLRGLRQARRQGAGPGKLVSFPDGVEELPRAIAARLGDRVVRARVRGVAREAGSWRIDVEGKLLPRADAVVLALPPAPMSNLLEPRAPEAAATLRQIPQAGVAVVCLGFPRRDLGMELDGYGFLVARGERPTILGCQFESTVFPGRAPAGHVLLRVIIGGTFEPDAVTETDATLVGRAVADLKTAAGLSCDPELAVIYRHPAALPQYELGHEQRVQAIEAAAARLPGLHLLGIGLRGVGMSDCVRNATALAKSIGVA